ncbi:universal stress protein [Paracoccus marinaquae]|uniref:Universal stress protein n=1 Tax=Paracoccus marinaquae TaxID=2841926 RepID=A0ABS6AE58_9RHOB|nr:universal stress protein [Paracoccus marinaquae]MBU3028898.1 universal stress protein [Paracoccus marinaquae]
MVTAAHPPTVLVTLDPASEHDRTHLFDIAEGHAAMLGARLVFLSVVPEIYLSTSTDPEGVIAGMTAHAEREQARLLEGRWPDAGAAPRLVRYGPVAGTIIEVAKEVGAQLIVMHARRPGIATYALGSVASRVANHAEASVLVIRDPEAAR